MVGSALLIALRPLLRLYNDRSARLSAGSTGAHSAKHGVPTSTNARVARSRQYGERMPFHPAFGWQRLIIVICALAVNDLTIRENMRI